MYNSKIALRILLFNISEWQVVAEFVVQFNRKQFQSLWRKYPSQDSYWMVWCDWIAKELNSVSRKVKQTYWLQSKLKTGKSILTDRNQMLSIDGTRENNCILYQQYNYAIFKNVLFELWKSSQILFEILRFLEMLWISEMYL